MKVGFAFHIGQEVRLRAIDRPCTVRQACFDGVMRTYQVSYWFNGDRKCQWVNDDELQLPKLGDIR